MGGTTLFFAAGMIGTGSRGNRRTGKPSIAGPVSLRNILAKARKPAVMITKTAILSIMIDHQPERQASFTPWFCIYGDKENG